MTYPYRKTASNRPPIAYALSRHQRPTIGPLERELFAIMPAIARTGRDISRDNVEDQQGTLTAPPTVLLSTSGPFPQECPQE